jgi:pimeloyl-ACP methyl ester carboxylesterase
MHALVGAVSAFLLFSSLSSAVSAQTQAGIFLDGSSVSTQSAVSAAVPGCPNNGGILDSVSVPVDQPLSLRVVLFSPAPPGGVTVQLSSDDPSIAAAGDRRQGFLPIVMIPEGGTLSNPFTIFGISVGQTRLRLTPLTPGFGVSAFPLGAWDVNKSGNALDSKFLDANDPNAACRDPGSPSLTSNASLQATCGRTVKGVASDGLNALLLRTLSGLSGTACFEIVSASALDQGSIQSPLTLTQSVSPFNYGFSYYTPPEFYGDSSASRSITVEFSFTPDIGNGNTSKIRAQTTIVRPPVMLIHGLWSDSTTWSKDYIRNDRVHTTYLGDYKTANASSFSTNQNKVKDYLAETLKLFRQKGYAATQADVLAHSMGGLLTRLYAGTQSFTRPDNLNKGDVHRLITLDTPHFGSNFANLLVALHRANPPKTESTVLALTGGSVLNGAVCDLSENSPALQGLGGGTSLMAEAITATGGPAGSPAHPALFWGGATIFGVRNFEAALTDTFCTNWVVDPSGAPVCLSSQFYFPQTTVDGFRFREQNDAVVPLSSEQGGIGGINFPQYIHFVTARGLQTGVTAGSDVAAQAFQILDGPDGGLVPVLPPVPSNGAGTPKTVPGRGAPLDQQDFANQCIGGPMKSAVSGGLSFNTFSTQQSADPRVNVVSPAAGASLTQGDTLTIIVELTPPLTVANTVGATLTGLTHVSATWTTALRFTATFLIPPLVTGPLTITPDFTDQQGNTFIGAPITVGVIPAIPIAGVAFQQHSFLKTPGAASQQLYLRGTAADASEFDLTSSLAGTTYSTSDPSVVTVNGDGLAQIVGPGFASITGTNGALSDIATFVVEDPANPLPPTDLTSQVTISKSGFRLDRTRGFFVQDIVVTNTSQSALPGPLYLVFSGLRNGVTLVNKSGLTQQLQPIGSPYIALSLPGEGLTMPPGNSASFTLQFLNPSRQVMDYSLALLRTSVAP